MGKSGPYEVITTVTGMIALFTWAILIYVILSKLSVDIFIWYLFALYIIFSILTVTFGVGAKREQEDRIVDKLIDKRLFSKEK